MTVAEALAAAQGLGMERLDAQLLLLRTLERDAAGRAWLLAHDAHLLDDAQAASFLAMCERRLAGEPVAYLLGHREFHGLDLLVDHRVLVPRPDTETLVEWALEVIAPLREPRVLDLGTGSGAIALAIARARPDARVEAVDASAAALEVARANAHRLGLPVVFRRADWLAGCTGACELIVANPPYVAEGDPHLPALRHEPQGALVAGPDGLADLRRIIAAAPPFLQPGGWLLLEHGWDQAPVVRELLRQAGLEAATSRRDLAGIGRCSGARRAEHG